MLSCELCHTYEQVNSHIWMRQFIYDCVNAHMNRPVKSRTNEWCVTWVWECFTCYVRSCKVNLENFYLITLQHTATHCNTNAWCHTWMWKCFTCYVRSCEVNLKKFYLITLQHTATHYYTLQCAAANCNACIQGQWQNELWWWVLRICICNVLLSESGRLYVCIALDSSAFCAL